MSFIVNINGKPQIYLANADLGTSGRAYNMSFEYDAIDVTAFSDNAHRNLLGKLTFGFRYDGLFNDAAKSSHFALNDILAPATGSAMSIWPAGVATGTVTDGTFAVPVTGVGIATARAMTYRPAGNLGDAVSLGADIFSALGTYDNIVSFGTAFSVDGAVTNSLVSSIWSHGTTSTNGAVIYLHVLSASASGGNAQWLLRMQDSSSTVAGSFFNLQAGTPGSAGNNSTFSTAAVVTGSFRAFRRFVVEMDAVSGSITVFGALGSR